MYTYIDLLYRKTKRSGEFIVYLNVYQCSSTIKKQKEKTKKVNHLYFSSR